MRVVVVPYDPSWPLAFQAIRAELLRILGPTFQGRIEHVGSTSIPEMWAKAIIDIDIVAPLAAHPDIIVALVHSGRYALEKRSETFERESFKLIPGPTHSPSHSDALGPELSGDPEPDVYRDARRNVYLTTPTSLSLKNHIAIRGVLRQRPDLVLAYSETKRSLGERDFGHIDEYVALKSEVLEQILGVDGGFSEEEMKRIRGGNMLPVARPVGERTMQ